MSDANAPAPPSRPAPLTTASAPASSTEPALDSRASVTLGTLLGARRFGPLFWTQFLGAFNDNLFKNAMVALFAFRMASAEEADRLVSISAGVFILPFFLFSATAGQLADKLDKARLIRWVKLAEIAIMAVGTLGFVLASTPLLMVALFFLGAQAAAFGPVKYGILPQHLDRTELMAGNGLIEMGTFLAILLGTIGGSSVMGLDSGAVLLIGSGVLVVAVLGWLAGRRVPPAPSSTPELVVDWNPVTSTRTVVQAGRAYKPVFLSILAISWFWFYGAMFLQQLPGYARDVLAGGPGVLSMLLAVFSVGIGLGSVLCERASGKSIELGLVPLGALGLTVFPIDLFFATPAAHLAQLVPASGLAFLAGWARVHLLLDLVAIGVSGGFFIVPLYAFIQYRSAPAERSRIIAANNIWNALFMVVASVVAVGLHAVGLSTTDVLLVTGLLNVLVCAYVFWTVPEFLLRFVVWMLMRTVYRLRTRGIEQIPADGPAVLVCNHVSFVDALVIAAACRRPVRFVMDHRIFKAPVLSWLFRVARAIPIAPVREDPELLERAFAQIGIALDEGDVVCIFPEGKLTSHGELNPFKAGVERILARNAVPVVPMALVGLWGSFFSRKDAAAMTRPFRRGMRSRVELRCGSTLPAARATAELLQSEVQALMA